MTKKIIKIGGSLALILPPEDVRRLRLKPGDKVEIYSDGNTLKVVPMTRIKPIKLGGLWKGVHITEEDIAEVRREMWGESLR